jgi:hypothetical protein
MILACHFSRTSKRSLTFCTKYVIIIIEFVAIIQVNAILLLSTHFHRLIVQREVFFITKKLTAILFAAIIATSAFSLTALAGDGKVQGDKGVGTVSQNGPCPFGAETPPSTP